MGRIGYKKCADNRIVQLKIKGKNNEGRLDVVDKYHAKFRCSSAYVMKIFDMFDPNVLYTSAVSLQYPNFMYKVNKIVSPSYFDRDIDRVCGAGIHYFLTRNAAFYYDKPRNYTGPWFEYDDNGRKWQELNYKDGKFHGEYKEYHKSGQLQMHCFFKDGEYHGEYKEYHESGQLQMHLFFKDGIRHGENKEYYESGQLSLKCFNKDGNLHGEYKEYNSEGVCNVECNYENGDRTGDFISRDQQNSVLQQGKYRKGVKYGKWVRYHPY